MACDGTAKKMIKQAEKKKVLALKGDEEDTIRKVLIEEIINFTSKKSPEDAFIDVLSQIIAWVCKKDENLNEYANRFSGEVERYVKLKYTLTTAKRRQFAFMLLQNAVLPADTMNTIMYQLTMAKKRDKYGILVI